MALSNSEFLFLGKMNHSISLHQGGLCPGGLTSIGVEVSYRRWAFWRRFLCIARPHLFFAATQTAFLTPNLTRPTADSESQ